MAESRRIKEGAHKFGTRLQQHEDAAEAAALTPPQPRAVSAIDEPFELGPTGEAVSAGELALRFAEGEATFA